MATGISGKSFIDLIKKSGVVSEEDLKRSLINLQERADVSLDDSDAVARALVEQGVLTRWQAEKILQGKSKGFTLGQYRLLDMLGKGGMGAVYLAEHSLMRRRCAIKVLPARNVGSRSYFDRFIREAQAVAAMDHPNIVRAYDVNQAKVGDAEMYFLAMEFVEGRDLQRVVDEGGRPLSYTEAAEYIRQAAQGLAHAHEAKMVHRDIKPANLLLNTKGVVKILDLGLAKFYDEQQQEAASLTREHNETVLGTADYLAPEQAVDSHNIDERADIYSLGCTFYFLLTGRPPFCEGSVATRLLHHQIMTPTPIRELRSDPPPDSLVAIIDRMMAKKPDERYQTAQDVEADLEVWLVENGNEQWREQNPELVRKVGESSRAETKIIARSQVDTAELDLNDDLDLAPDEEHETTVKSSPLTAGDSGVKKSPAASSSVHDSGLNLSPEEIRAARTKPASGTKETAVPAATTAAAQPLSVELPPLESPALVSLDDLQLDVLSAEPLANPAAELGPLDDTSALSSGIGLAQPAQQATQTKKQEDNFPIPMPWIVGIACVAVVMVLGLFLVMIFSGGRDETNVQRRSVHDAPVASGVAPGDGAPEIATTNPPVTPDAPVSPDAVGPTVVQPPQTENALPADNGQTPTPEAPQPEAVQEPSETPSQFNPTTTPDIVETPPPPTPAAEPVPPQPEPASTASPRTVEPPAVSPTTEPAPAPAAAPEQPLLAKLDRVNIKIETNLPGGRSKTVGEEGMKTKIVEVLGDAEIREDSKSPFTLQIKLQTDPVVRDQRTKFRFTVTATLTAPDAAGKTVEVWSDKETSDEIISGQFISVMRNEVGSLIRRATNERKRLLGEM